MKILKITLTLFVSLLFLNACKKTDYCQKYNQDLNLLRVRGEQVQKHLDLKFSPAPEMAKSFNKNWYYFEQETFTIPLPKQPKRLTQEEKQGGDISIIAEDYTVVLGDDSLKGLPEHISSFLKSSNIQSDYDFNFFIFSDLFLQCNDITNKKELVAKSTLAMAKSVRAPFDMIGAFHLDEAEVIVLYGTQQSKSKYVSHIFIRVDAQNSKTAMVYFKNQEHQDQFHSYLSKIHDKAFFKPGKLLKI